MGEKRFEVDVDHLLLVWDTEKNKRLEIEDIVGLLNEQQATNDYLEESNSRLQVQLGKTLRLVDEQQATIEEQNKEIEESSAFIIEQRKENKKLNEENEKLTKMLNANYKTNNELVQYIQMLEKESDDE